MEMRKTLATKQTNYVTLMYVLPCIVEYVTQLHVFWRLKFIVDLIVIVPPITKLANLRKQNVHYCFQISLHRSSNIFNVFKNRLTSKLEASKQQSGG